MTVGVSAKPRVSVAGKFFRLGAKKFYAKGVAYGPFAPNAAGQPFASPEQTAADFAQIRELGATLVRIYAVPGKWFLDLALEHDLKVLVDVPWNQNLCFLDSGEHRQQARDAVRGAVAVCGRHPAVFAFSVANEISPEVVRWSGSRAVADFIDELVLEAKRIDPECLCTYTNFPPTEFLRPQALDFVCFNVYLHQQPAFRNYLSRLQMLAESKPLVLGEIGIDSLREGEPRKCEILSWQIEAAFRGGVAGAVVFSFTDDWWRGGQAVEDWQMGITTRDRQPKDSYAAVQKGFALAPCFPLVRYPRISVVVASYNGDRTLKACLESLQQLDYPDFEVILVDDGSTDATAQIAFLNAKVRYLRHATNLGLSVARNTGIAAATGEVVAFTDSDCRADENWLYYLASDLLRGGYAGMGGPNELPPEDSAVAMAVMASPGGPAHVMLTDQQAEHIPGCNMAFFKWALDEVGGFDPVFHQAGDDVDLCWRVQQAGHKIGFSPGALVWHYRRSRVADYLRQQHGYGEAEALLVNKHPEYFNWFGGSIWRGRIYGPQGGVRLRPSIIYHGLFGSAGFQSLYASEPALSVMLCTTLEYQVLVTLPLWILTLIFHPLLPLAIASFALSLAVCAAAGAQASLLKSKSRPWSRPLVALLFLLQPIVRGWARYQGRLLPRPARLGAQQTLDSLALRGSGQSLERVEYWSARPINRLAFVGEVLRCLERRGWPARSDTVWREYDAEIYGSRWTHLQLTTVVEDHAREKHLLRCRLRPRWSLQAKVIFGAGCALEFLVLGFAAPGAPWLWLLLLTLPLFAWALRREQRTLQSMMILLLDEIAEPWKLSRVLPSFDSPAPRTGGDRPAAPAGSSPFSGQPQPQAASEPAALYPPAQPASAPGK
jgi:GT2 family glycosyltransferase